jgi:hypothetical protein
VTDEGEIARAQRKSREWKARQAEMAEAAREDAERIDRRHAALEREREENYHERGLRNLVLIGAGALVILLMFERFAIVGAAEGCLEGAKHPHEYNCAAQLTRSFWFWLLPGDLKAALPAGRPGA